MCIYVYVYIYILCVCVCVCGYIGHDLGLDMHTDDSDVTLNVCLGREFTGAGESYTKTMRFLTLHMV